MLYTDEQLVSFANTMLQSHGIDHQINQSDRRNWEETNNIQPIQVGQPLHIDMLDGLKITATIDVIEKEDVK